MIDVEGENKGLVALTEAQALATEAKLDLVEIVPNADVPVCRIMDYGKFRFEESKKAQMSRKKQKKTTVKEIKFRPGTEEADYQVKLRKLTEFLEDGDKTKITIRFRGREMAHRELGKELLDKIEKDLSEFGDVEQWPKMEGRQMVMVIAPTKKKK